MPPIKLPQIDDYSTVEWDFTDPPKPSGAKPRPRATRAQLNALVERKLGWAGQLLNTLASPDTKAGVVVGPVNAISKLGNALGDWAQGKPIDTRDAWQIPEETVRKYNPFRIGIGQEVTPADRFGFQVGGGIGAEIAGAAVGATLIKRLGQVGQLKQLANAFRNTQAARSIAVAQRASVPLRTGLQVGKNVGEALTSTVAATPFLDVSQGNLANVGDAFGLKLPGRVDETDNYLDAFGKTVRVEGLAAPLTFMGALSFIGPVRRAMFGGEGIKWLDDLAEQELEPYTRQWRNFRQPQLPPGEAPRRLPSAQMQAAADGSPITPATINVDTPGGALPGTAPGLPQLPGYQPRGGALATVPEALPTGPGSAIERYYDEATQIRQVEEQRQRLVDAGLIREGENGQWELNVANGVDPEVEKQIRDLQTQRGVLLEQLSRQPDVVAKQTSDLQAQRQTLLQQLSEQPDAAGGINKRLDEIDQQIANLGNPLSAAADDTASLQKQLDELDAEIADLTMSGTTKEFLNLPPKQLEFMDTRPELDTFLANLDELSDKQLQDIHSRVLREVGAERNATELADTQQRVQELNQRLEEINSRLEAGDITPRGAKGLITKTQREIQAAEQQLQDIQQRLNSPESTVRGQLNAASAWLQRRAPSDTASPSLREVGRSAEVYGYSNSDEYRGVLQGWDRDRLRSFAQPSTNPEVAAIVKTRTGRRVWASKKSDIVDALVELAERKGWYLSPEPDQLVDPFVREQMKADILRRAIDNGEVQAPVTPIPNRPSGPRAFNQGTFVDDLFSDETGQMLAQFVNDELPPYKAGGKNADALIDEMRLRFEYNVLDAKAMQAQKDALMAAHGWDRLSWEDKKRLGLMGRGMFALSRDELPDAATRTGIVTGGVDPLQTFQPTRQFNSGSAGGGHPMSPDASGPYQEVDVDGVIIKVRALDYNRNIGEYQKLGKAVADSKRSVKTLQGLLDSLVARGPAKGKEAITPTLNARWRRQIGKYEKDVEQAKAQAAEAEAALAAADARITSDYRAMAAEQGAAADIRAPQPYRGEGVSPNSWWAQQAEQFGPAPTTPAKAAPTVQEPSTTYRGEGVGRADAINQPNFNPELKPKPERQPQRYVYTYENGRPQVVPEESVTQRSAPAETPAAAPAGKAKPKGKGKGKAATPMQKQAQEALDGIQAQRQEIQKRLDELRKKHQGGSC